MLDVTFDELTTGAPKEMLARERRRGVDERHCILQLVAKAEGSSRLVITAARPQAARHRLIDQPAVGQHIERRVRRIHLHGAKRALPVRVYGVPCNARGGRSAEAL